MRTTVKEKSATWRQAQQSGIALFSWRRSVGLNRPTFAELARVSERSLANYEKSSEIPAAARPQITEALRLVKALQEIVPGQELAAWLQTPNLGFGGKRPLALVQNGELDLIWAMIHQTRMGAFG